MFLSLRYHLLHPDYLYFRIRELQKSFRLRVILCHVDVVGHPPLKSPVEGFCEWRVQDSSMINLRPSVHNYLHLAIKFNHFVSGYCRGCFKVKKLMFSSFRDCFRKMSLNHSMRSPRQLCFTIVAFSVHGGDVLLSSNLSPCSNMYLCLQCDLLAMHIDEDIVIGS